MDPANEGIRKNAFCIMCLWLDLFDWKSLKVFAFFFCSDSESGIVSRLNWYIWVWIFYYYDYFDFFYSVKHVDSALTELMTMTKISNWFERDCSMEEKNRIRNNSRNVHIISHGLVLHGIAWYMHCGMAWYGLLPVVFITIFALRFCNNSLIKYKTTYSHKRKYTHMRASERAEINMYANKLHLFKHFELIYRELKRAKWQCTSKCKQNVNDYQCNFQNLFSSLSLSLSLIIFPCI